MTAQTASGPAPEWLRVEEAAARLQVTPRVVRGAIHRGELPGSRRIGKEYRVPAIAVTPPGVAREG